MAAAVVVACSRASAGELVCFPEWTAVAPEFFPLVPAAPVQPVLTAADVHDSFAFFVADPFLVHLPGLWYMFFEVTVPQGRIALASSLDGIQWKYERIVLSEPYQLSYPLVFQVDGVWYMTPEAAATQSVRLYRAENFPDGWIHVADLVTGRTFADPTLFRYDGLWWMWVGNGASDMCWLYYSESLDAGWTEHPASPIVNGNRGRARPGGRAIVLSDNRLYRLAQNSSPTYGRALRVFQVDVLTTAQYAEHEVAASPIVQASGSGWNADGMHHVDPWWTGSEWIAATDGIQAGVWTIGIYRTQSIPSDLPPAVTGAERLHCAPNPSSATTTIEWVANAARSPARLSVFTPSGRRVLSRVIPGAAARFVWDGTDDAGRTVPAGVYFCTLETPSGGTQTARVVRAR